MSKYKIGDRLAFDPFMKADYEVSLVMEDGYYSLFVLRSGSTLGRVHEATIESLVLATPEDVLNSPLLKVLNESSGDS